MVCRDIDTTVRAEENGPASSRRPARDFRKELRPVWSDKGADALLGSGLEGDWTGHLARTDEVGIHRCSCRIRAPQDGPVSPLSTMSPPDQGEGNHNDHGRA